MVATIMATTASGSTYVISLDAGGVRWYRVPSGGSMAAAAVGWQASPPRVVPGERLLLGPFRSTPVRRVAFLPGPSVGTTDWMYGAAATDPVRERGTAGLGPEPGSN